jgi:UDP-N-acetylmuramate-alanine ligase
LASADEIAGHLADGANSGDLVLIMSNGGFDGLTAKLLEKMKARAGVRG